MTTTGPTWLPGPTGPQGLDADRRLALERELDEVVGRIRQVKGLEGFLLPPPLSELLPAAEGGPVCIVNVSTWRCDALVVTTGGVEVVPLPGLDVDEADRRARDYLGRVATVARAGALLRDGAVDDEIEGVRAGSEAALDATLAWLWDVVAEPVLHALGHDAPVPDGGPWSRVWWCPTGPLALLPLHAAGHHGHESGATVLDRVVSSYTPTLRALVEARRRPPAPGDDRLLVVSLPEVDGHARLLHVERERADIVKRFADRHTPVNGPEATPARVADELARHRYVHLCCHGQQDLDDPSSGGLVLHGGMLTIAELGSRRHDGEMAFLSACKTAAGGLRLPDEAITLASALHYTGFRHVVGTLWSVGDEDAADVAADVYEHLTAGTAKGSVDASRAAFALHHAVHRLRDAHPDLPSLWTPFVHVGP